MKRAAIITLHYPYNYGSALQAFALQSYMRSKGVDTDIIDYRMPYDYENYKLFRTGIYASRPQALIADVLYLPANLRRKKNFERFQKEHLHLTPRRYSDWHQMRELNDAYDGFICGSDQIWNFECTNGIDPAYFLAFASSDKVKAAYAPSIAQLSFDVSVEDSMKRLLSDFKGITVRERSTIPFLKERTGYEARAVIDPTLLIGAESYRRIEKKPGQAGYVFVYLLEENFDLARYAVRVAKEKGLKLVYISNISKRARRLFGSGIDAFGISPEEFLGYIDGAEYVITNSFHATIFSILFHRRFVSFKTRKSFLRLQDLLLELGLEDRVYGEGIDLERAIDFDRAERRLEAAKAASLAYLDGVVGEIMA